MSAPSTHASPEGLAPHGVGPQDLSREGLLAQLPRDGDNRPLLGGIPLIAKLGQGGMGAVYYGVHPRLHNEVAIKVLPFHLADKNPILIKRFFAEARVAAKVKSPYIVNVMDVNEDEGVFYLVMEFVDGPTAAQILKRIQLGESTPPIEGRVAIAAPPPPTDPDATPPPPPAGLPEWAALEICIGAAQGLHAAHAYDIIHRDVKPDNILVPRMPNRGGPAPLDLRHAKLADLGLAKPEDSNSIGTISQLTMGTPGYMAPEQIRDAKRASKPADVFSLGATLYALLAGRSPFSGNSVGDLLVKTITEPHTPLRNFRPDLSDITHKVIDACLAKDPGERFADGAELLEALHLAASGVKYPSAALRSLESSRQSGLRAAPAGSGVTPAPSAAASAVAAAVSAGNEAKTPPNSGHTPVPRRVDPAGAPGPTPIAAGSSARAAIQAAVAAQQAQALAGAPLATGPQAAGLADGAHSTALVVPLSARERAAARLDVTPDEPQAPVQIAGPVADTPPQRISKQPPVIPDDLPDLNYSARVSRALSRLMRAEPGSRRPAPIWYALGALLLAGAALAGWYFGYELPRRAATREYTQAMSDVRSAEVRASDAAADAQGEKRHWQEVIAACQRALNARPDDPDARQAQQNAVAKLDQVTQEIKRSAENYRDALAEAQAAEEDARQATDLAAMLAAHKAAEKAYTRALRAHADDPAARDGRALARSAIESLETQIRDFNQAVAAADQAEKQAAQAVEPARRFDLLTTAFNQYQSAARIYADPRVTQAVERLGRLLPATEAATKAADALRQADDTVDVGRRLALLQLAVASYRVALTANDTPDHRAAWSAARRRFAREYFGGFLEVRRLDPYSDRGSRDNLLGFDLAPNGRLLAVRLPGEDVQLWSPGQQTMLRAIHAGNGLVLDARFLTNDLLATAGADKAARLWRVADGAPVRTLQDGANPRSHEGPVKFLEPSADGKYLLTAADDKTVRVWELAGGRLIATLAGHTGWISAASFSADGRRILTASHDRTARLWNAQTGELLREFKGHTGKLTTAAFDPVRPQMATAADDQTARLWNLNTGELLQELKGHTGAVTACLYSADGSVLVTASDDATARVWDPATGECKFVLRSHTGPLTCVHFGLDDSLVITSGADNSVRVWDLADGSLLTTLAGHSSPVLDARLTADGLSIFTVGDHTVREWSNPLLAVPDRQGASPDDAYRLALVDAGAAEATAKQVEADPYVAQATWERAARAWDRALRVRPDDPQATAGRAKARAKAAELADQLQQRETQYATALAAAKAAQATAAGVADADDKAGEMHRAYTLAIDQARLALAAKPGDNAAQTLLNECVRDRTAKYFVRLAAVARLAGHAGPVEALAFAPDGLSLASAGQDADIRVWSGATRRSLATLVGHKAWPNQLFFVPDGKTLVSADNVTVRLWDPLTGDSRAVIDEPNEAACGLSAAGRLVYTLTVGGKLKFWQVATAKTASTEDVGGLEVARLVFSADGAFAAAQLQNHSLRLLTGPGLKSIKQLDYDLDAPVTQLAFDPAGAILYAACLDGQVRRWALPGAKPLPALTGHQGKVYFVTLSADGALVLTGGEDRTARLYAAETGLLLNTLHGHGDSCLAGAFAPDGRALAVAGGNDIHLWCNPQDHAQPLVGAEQPPALYDAAMHDGAEAAFGLPELVAQNFDQALLRCERALRCYQSALAVTPHAPQARAEFGRLQAQWQSWRRQLDQYDAEIQAGQAALDKAQARRQGGADPTAERQSAVAHFDAALKLRPGDARALRLSQATTLAIEGNPFGEFQVARKLPPLTAAAGALRFAADGKAALAGQADGVVTWLDLTGGKNRTYKHHTAAVTAVDLSPDGDSFASGSADKTVRLVSVETGAILHILRVDSPVRTAAFSPTGKTVITGSEDGVARLWDTATATVYKDLSGHKGALNAARISRDADFVLTAGEDRTVNIWNLLEGKVLRAIEGHTGPVLGALYSPDGKTVLSFSADNTARLWSAGDGKLLFKFEGHRDPVVAAAFLPGGKTVVTAGADKTVRLWDALNGRELKRIELGAVARALTVSPDGKSILAAGDDKIVYLIADPADKSNPLLFNR